jgi:hypothetical protein
MNPSSITRRHWIGAGPRHLRLCLRLTRALEQYGNRSSKIECDSHPMRRTFISAFNTKIGVENAKAQTWKQ